MTHADPHDRAETRSGEPDIHLFRLHELGWTGTFPTTEPETEETSGPVTERPKEGLEPCDD